jgi:hypothetical protein
MKINSKIWIILSVALFLLMNSCAVDDIRGDLNITARLKTRSSTPLAIDLLSLHAITVQTRFTIQEFTQFGRAEFIANNALLFYTPDLGVTSTIDNINYQVCEGGNCKDYAIEVEILSPTVQIDTITICGQGAFADVDTIRLGELSKNIEVLANDRFCTSKPDSSKLKIITQPKRGIANVLVNNNSPYRYFIQYNVDNNAGTQPNPDVFVYSVPSKATPTDVKYAAVLIYYK